MEADLLIPPAAYVLLLALSTANVAGSTKKSISAGAIFVSYCVGKCVNLSLGPPPPEPSSAFSSSAS